MTRSNEMYAFLNRLRSLHNIDWDLLPELSEAQWRRFRVDPADYLIHCRDDQAAAIWREVEKRQRP